MSNPNWSDVLRDDETLLWQGQPEPTLNWKNKRLYGQMGWSVGLLLIVVVALIVSPDARSAPPVTYVFMAALLMFSFVRSWSAWFALRKTRYAVTNARVLWRRGALVRHLPRAGLTPADAEARLRADGLEPGPVVDFLARCDAARFAPGAWGGSANAEAPATPAPGRGRRGTRRRAARRDRARRRCTRRGAHRPAPSPG